MNDEEQNDGSVKRGALENIPLSVWFRMFREDGNPTPEKLIYIAHQLGIPLTEEEYKIYEKTKDSLVWLDYAGYIDDHFER